MKEKEIRAAQLDALKDASPYSVKYVVEIMNGAFKPFKRFTFSTMEDAMRKYDELEPVYYGGFLGRYAMVNF